MLGRVPRAAFLGVRQGGWEAREGGGMGVGWVGRLSGSDGRLEASADDGQAGGWEGCGRLGGSGLGLRLRKALTGG